MAENCTTPDLRALRGQIRRMAIGITFLRLGLFALVMGLFVWWACSAWEWIVGFFRAGGVETWGPPGPNQIVIDWKTGKAGIYQDAFQTAAKTIILGLACAAGTARAAAAIQRAACRERLRLQLRGCSQDEMAAVLLSLSSESSREVRQLVAPMIRGCKTSTELAPASAPTGRRTELMPGSTDRDPPTS